MTVPVESLATRPLRIALVGFEDQDNLGLRYLSGTLRAAGHRTRLIKLADRMDTVLSEVHRFQPDIIGLSLIFQFLLPAFAELAHALRAAGHQGHMTIGGHYPSFEPDNTLRKIPELDSVVRFEGEDTLLELANTLSAGNDWRQVKGIVYREEDGIAHAPARQGARNLDELPWPDRDDIAYERQRLPTASVLAGRGCPWRCSFCSIITFYEGNGTKGRRLRDPARIVDEVEHLHRDRGVRVILWQDDDFLAGGKAGVRWAHAIARECIDRGLHRNMRWKISCRSDEIRPGVLEPLVDAGLTHVYLGVESGDPESLKRLNKHLSPEVHLEAGRILRDLGLSFDFGFMLLDPWAGFATVRNNIDFLQRFAGDGASVVSFCRTLPYAGTPIADRLADEGRLRHADLEADYRFNDARLDALYEWLLTTFAERNHSGTGTVNLLRTLQFESRLDLDASPGGSSLQQDVRILTSLSNRLTLDCIRMATDHFEHTPGVGSAGLVSIAAMYDAEDRRLRRDVRRLMDQHAAGAWRAEVLA